MFRRRRFIQSAVYGAVAGGAAFAFDNSNTGNFGAAATVFNHSLPAVAANTVCIVSIIANGGPIVSVTDSVGSYTKVTGSPNGTMELWFAFHPASQGAGGTLTVTGTSSATMDLVFASFTGRTGANIDTGGTYVLGASPTWTTSVSNTLLVGAIGPTNGNLTATAPWVGISFASAFNTLVYKIASAPVSSDVLLETGSGGFFGDVITAFK